jgi:hypothetical protein
MHVTEVEVPRFPHASVPATQLAINVVYEGALLAGFEENSHDAGATRDDRGHHLDRGPYAPLLVGRMKNAIAEAKKEPFLAVEHVVTNWTAG